MKFTPAYKSVVFDFSFGDNDLEVEADVTLGAPERSGATVLPEDSYPAEPDEVEFASVVLVDEDEYRSKFEPCGVFYKSHISSKVISLEDALHDAAIDAVRLD
jgi:hypothetical protein